MLLILMIATICVTTLVHGLLQAYAPSNALRRHVRSSSPNLRAGCLLALLGFACLGAGHVVSLALEAGAPGWLNLVALVLAWDTMKFAVLSVQTVLEVLVDLSRRTSPSGMLTS